MVNSQMDENRDKSNNQSGHEDDITSRRTVLVLSCASRKGWILHPLRSCFTVGVELATRPAYRRLSLCLCKPPIDWLIPFQLGASDQREEARAEK